MTQTIDEIMTEKAKVKAAQDKAESDTLKDTIRVFCESNPRLFLEFKSYFPRKLQKQFLNTLKNFDEIVIDEDTGEERPITQAEIDADDVRRMAIQDQVLRKIIVDGRLTFDGGIEVEGAEAIFARDNDDMDTISFSFYSGAFLKAIGRLGELGNARKLG